MLLDPGELQQFQNHSSQMAALDFMVSIASDTFIPTYDGNMAKVVEGHRRYRGFKKTILLDRKRLVELLDLHQNGTLSWNEFAVAVRSAHEKRMGQPTRRRVIADKPKEEDYFYANHQECLLAFVAGLPNQRNVYTPTLKFCKSLFRNAHIIPELKIYPDGLSSSDAMLYLLQNFACELTATIPRIAQHSNAEVYTVLVDPYKIKEVDEFFDSIPRGYRMKSSEVALFMRRELESVGTATCRSLAAAGAGDAALLSRISASLLDLRDSTLSSTIQHKRLIRQSSSENPNDILVREVAILEIKRRSGTLELMFN
ncbi:hypothetical protein DKX38_016034 [Salix brachista]|uniref:O-fucosyltransferase family protein n=1 Tax=Salix brachista TaxID=2182728 RepID=A0A5N5L8Y2_9ROSI|nr:hypothetical protein DKX38_016034 [Salix brachista]